MRTASSLYLDLANYPTYGDLAAAKVSYADLAVKTFHDVSSAGASSSNGGAGMTAMVRLAADASVLSGGSANSASIEALWGAESSGQSSSFGSAVLGQVLTTTGSSASSSAGSLDATTVEALWSLSADASSSSAGSASIRERQSAALSGQSTSVGSAGPGMIEAKWFLTAQGTATTGGSLTAALRARTKVMSGSPVTMTYGELSTTCSSYTELAANYYNYARLTYRLEDISSTGSAAASVVRRVSSSGSSASGGTASIRTVSRVSASSGPAQTVTYGEIAGLFTSYTDLGSYFSRYINLAYPRNGSFGTLSLTMIEALWPVSAAAVSASGGTASLRQRGSIAAAGSSDSGGSVRPGTIIRTTGQASATSGGFANPTMIEAIWYLSSAGQAGSGGDLGLVAIRRVLASGSSTSAGFLDATNIEALWYISTNSASPSLSAGRNTTRLIIRSQAVGSSTSGGSTQPRHLAAANGWGIPI